MRMRKGIRTIFTGCALGLASQTLGTMDSGDGGHLVGFDSCHGHLHALVDYLQETAQLEGKTLAVEWRDDGTAVVRCSDFSQYIWCEDGEMHIEFGDPVPEGPDN